MKIVVAIDSFKGSLSSIEAGNAVKESILKINTDVDVAVKPISDGGEGTVEALASGLDGEIVKIKVKGPLFEEVEAKYCILNDKTAVIEMAEASGLTLVPPDKRNPMHTTTYGVGQLIKDAIERGCRNFIIGIGGSATNDVGTGMLSALGFEFLDKDNTLVDFGAKGLEHIVYINAKNVLSELFDCNFKIASDVNNPLCGLNGCSHIFAPQKGAKQDQIKFMDLWIDRYSKICDQLFNKDFSNFPGAGAAGGLGYAFMTFFDAILEPGVKIVLEEIKLEDEIKDADLVITGEGKLDYQTIMGKAPIGIAKLAKKYSKPVIAFCGMADDGAEICNEHGIDAYFPILQKVTSLEEAMDKKNAYINLKNTATQVLKLIIRE